MLFAPKPMTSMLLLGALIIAHPLVWSKSPHPKSNPPPALSSRAQTTKAEMAGQTERLRALMLSLYTEYPQELAKSTQVGPREMTEWVFDGKANWKFDAIRSRQKTEALALVFDPEYRGDSVLALIVGLETLLFDAYGATNEFEIPPKHDLKRLQRVRCQLQALQAQLNHPETTAKQIALLESIAAKSLIMQTLEHMRLQLQAASATVSASPDTDC